LEQLVTHNESLRKKEDLRIFGTPAVNLIVALETSLKIICKEGMNKSD
jgi:aspartate aminotransferase-like enzyme